MFKVKQATIACLGIAITTAAVIAGCGGSSSTSTSTQPVDLTAATNAATADNTFGFKLLNQTVSSSPTGSNVMISPVCASQMLMLAYNGAGGETATQIANVLGYGSVSLHQADIDTQNVVRSLTTADPNVEIDIANATWLQTGINYTTTYRSNVEQFLNAQVGSLNFTQSQTAANTINAWAGAHTKGHITSIISANDLIQNSTQFALANAVYFHGAWSDKYFDPTATLSGSFVLQSGATIQVPYMHATSQTLMYTGNNTSQAVEIPYGKGRLFLLVLLPASGSSVDSLLTTLSTDGITPWTSAMIPGAVDLTMPKFNLSYTDATMADDLKQMGMVDAFSQSTADLTPMGLPKGYHIGAAYFKSTFDLDETGTTATGVGVLSTGFTTGGVAGDPYQMNVTRPFVCAICDSVTGAILFAGVVQNPALTS